MDITRFPALDRIDDNNAQLECAPEPQLRKIDVLGHCSKDDVFRAWGAVLKAYTGLEHVSFFADDSVVGFNTTDQSLVVRQHTGCQKTDCTAFTFGPGSVYDDADLAIHLSIFGQELSAKSWSCLSVESLKRVVHFFELALQWIYQGGTGDIPVSELMTLDQSIANANAQHLDGPSLLHALVPRSSRLAIEFSMSGQACESVNYNQLHDMSHSVASLITNGLKQQHPTRQPVIALLIPQSTELYVAQLAVLKSGCAFCSISLDTPAERLSFLLEDMSASLLLTTMATPATAIPKHVHVLQVNLQELPLVSEKDSALFFEVSASDIAYIMYTSGSTGRPKGVPISHRAVTQSLIGHDRHIPQYSRFLQFAAPTFDVSIFEIYFTFLREATLVGCYRRDMLDDLAGTINRLDVDAAELTPTVAGSLLQSRSAVPGLQLLLTIGEMLTQPVIREFGGAEDRESILWAMYGPTEAAIHCTIMPRVSASSRVGNIGYPLETVSAFIAAPVEGDAAPDLNVVPLGCVGELVVGGHQLANGYLNRHEQTKLAFVHHQEYGTLYRTGDKARMLADGTFECFGRIGAGQVKLRGQRIETGEIENIALRAVGCRAAVVSVISNNLILFCCVDDDTSTSSIQALLTTWLPEYMRPTETILLPKFPQLPSGKTDRKKIELDYAQQSLVGGADEKSILDRDERSKEVLRVIALVINQDVTMATLVSQLGIDSLSAITLSASLRSHGVHISTLDILGCRSISDLIQHSTASPTTMSIPRSNSESQSALREALADHLPLHKHWAGVEAIRICTPVQLGMLIESNIQSHAYWNTVGLQLSSALSTSNVERALSHVRSENEILRSGFVYAPTTKHQVFQIVWKPDYLAHLSADIGTINAHQHDNDSLLSPFSYSWSRRDGMDLLVLTMHHSIYDGWSVDIIVQDLMSWIQTGATLARPQFSIVQDFYANVEACTSETYWKTQLQSCRPTEIFEADMNGTHFDSSADSTTEAVHVCSSSLKAIRNAAAKTGITAQCYFQAAFACLVANLTGEADIILATVTSGRTIPLNGIEAVVGPCMTTLPLRINTASALTVSDLLLNVHDSNRKMAEHCILPLRSIMKLAGLPLGAQLSQILFIWQESLAKRTRDDNNAIVVVHSPDQTEFRLIAEFEPQNDQVEARLHGAEALMRAWDVQGLLCHVDELVDIFLRYPNQTVADLPLGDKWKETLNHSATRAVKDPVFNSQPLHAAHDLSITESQVLAAVADIMQISSGSINPREPLSRYGLDSLYAIAMSSSLRKKGFTSVSTAMILQYQNISQIAGKLGQPSNRPQDEARPFELHFLDSTRLIAFRDQLSRRDIEYQRILPCTPLQEAMLAASHRTYQAYWNTMEFEIKGTTIRLEQAWNHVLTRHDIFRTIFVPCEDSRHPYVQVVLRDLPPMCLVQRKQANQADHEELGLPVFQDEYEPLHRSFILKRGSQSILRYSCHHAMYDSLAMQQLLFEVEAIYNATHIPTPTVADAFLRLSVANRSDEAIRFWCTQFESFSPTLVTFTGVSAQHTYSQSLTVTLHELRNTVQCYDISSMAVFETALAKTLAELLTSSDICFGKVVSGRTVGNTSFDQIVFPTFNTVPVRADLSTVRDNVALMKAFHHRGMAAERYQLAPLRSVQTFAGFPTAGLFSALLLVQQGRYLVDEALWSLLRDSGTIEMPMIFELVPNREHQSLELNFHYDRATFTSSEASQISSLFDFILHQSIRYPTASVLSSPLDHSISIPDISSRLYKPIQTPFVDPTVVDIAPSLSMKSDSYLNTVLSSFTGHDIKKVNAAETIHFLGIDSISSIQLANRLTRDLARKITSSDILKRPRIAELAQWLKALTPRAEHFDTRYDFVEFECAVAKQVCEYLRLEPTSLHSVVETTRPCTPLQCGLISQAQRVPGAYISAMSIAIPCKNQPRDISAIMLAWTRRNPILRSVFVPIDHESPSFATAYLKYYDWHKLWTVSRWTQHYLSMEIPRIEVLDANPAWNAVVMAHPDDVHVQLTIAHALFDARSLAILLDDLTSLFQSNGARSMLSSPSYDHVLGHVLTESLSDDAVVKAGHRNFWETRWSGLVPPPFPCLCPLRGDTGHAIVERDTQRSTRALEKSLAEHGVTLQAAAEATWACVLSEYTGESRVSFGVVLSGVDSIPHAAEVAFPCMVTVPCVANVSQDHKLLLNDMMEYNAQIRDHQFCTGKDIASWVNLSGSPLFDTILVVQHSYGHGKPRDWKILNESARDEFTVSIELITGEYGNLRLRAAFDQAKVPSQQAKLMLQQFQTVLINYAFPERDNHHPTEIISVSTPSMAVLPSPTTVLHGFVEFQITQMPSTTALEFVYDISGGEISSRVWTYQELNARANAIAAFLQASDIRPRSLVAVCFDKCAEASFAILGILKAGCAYVALDPKAPAARKAYIIKDSEARMILTSGDLCGDLNGVAADILDQSIRIQAVGDHTGSSDAFKPVAVSSSDLCYCLYTSGTTGKPKGCLITHENAVQAMRAFSKQFTGRWTSESKWLQFASLHFDVSVLEQFWPWSEGLSVVSASRDLMLDDLPAFIRALQVTHLDLTPSLASLLEPEEVPTLHKGVFITGGETLRQDILDKWGPKEAIFNAYGPTECTIGVTMFAGVPSHGRPSNIGWQFDNVGCYVLEPEGKRAVLRGGIGELCIAGKLVGKGYLNNPELTRAKFPLLETYGEKVYRTGDLVRLLHDNSFQFLGRSDEQVKLRGQRLEIGEINSVIKASDHVKQVTTFVSQHPKQAKEHLVSFIVLKEDSHGQRHTLSMNQQSLRVVAFVTEHCSLHLPPYMIPTYIVPVNYLPLTANNKIDHNALRDFFKQEVATDVNAMSTASLARKELSRRELQIAEILIESFGVERAAISSSSSIFELGLDSISAIRLARHMKQNGFVDATPMFVMQAPTIAAMAAGSSEPKSADNERRIHFAFNQKIKALTQRHLHLACNILDLNPRQVSAILPCTSLQAGMLSETFSSQSDSYFLSFDFKLSAGIDIQRLRNAWATVHASLNILRTRFMSCDSGVAQVIATGVKLPWNEISSLERDLPCEISKERSAWTSRNTDRITEPMRVVVYSTDTHKFLSLMLFHGLYDGQSLTQLLQLVYDTYMNTVRSEVPAQFDHVLPHGPLRSFVGAEHWRATLKQGFVAIPRLVTTESARDIGKMISLKHVFPIAGLEQIRRWLNVPHQAMIQACWSVVLGEYCQGTPIIGLVASGRSLDLDGVERVIGPMINTILFRPSFHTTDTWQQFVKSCHAFNIASLPYQHDGLRDVLKSIGKPASSMPDNLFIFEVQSEDMRRAQQNDLWHMASPDPVALCPLTFEATLADTDMSVTLVARTTFMTVEILERLMNRFDSCMRALLTRSEELITDSVDVVVQDVTSQLATDDVPNGQTNGTFGYLWSHAADVLREEVGALIKQQPESISPHQSVYAMGLDSIDVVILSSRIKKRGLVLPTNLILGGPSIHQMSEHVVILDNEHTPHLNDGISVMQHRITQSLMTDGAGLEAIEKVLPATPLQEAMISRMLITDFEEYYNFDVLEIDSQTDLEKLERTWEVVIARFELFRTGFAAINDSEMNCSYAQVIHSPTNFTAWKMIYAQEPEMTDILARIRSEARAQSIFNPLLRLTVVHGSTKRFLVLSLPHALYDGWSIRLLHEDVKRIYHGGTAQSSDANAYLEETIAGAEDRGAKEFWRNNLANCVPTSCTVQHDSTSYASGRAEQVSSPEMSRIRAFCMSTGITIHCLMQTCYSLVLAAKARSLDVTFGLVLSGRDSMELQQVQFPTMNTIVCRCMIFGTCVELLQSVQAALVDVRRYQHYPLRKIQQATEYGNDLFDTLFLHQTRPAQQNADLPEIYRSVGGASEVQYALSVESDATDDTLTWRAATKAGIMSTSSLQDLLVQLDQVLAFILDNANTEVVRLLANDVQIADLAPLRLDASVPINGEPIEAVKETVAQQPNPLEASVRNALSQLSKLPDHEIEMATSIYHYGLDSISAIKLCNTLKKQGLSVKLGDVLKDPTITGIAQAITANRQHATNGTNANHNISVQNRTEHDVSSTARSLAMSIEDIVSVSSVSAGQLYFLAVWNTSRGNLFYSLFTYQVCGDVSEQAIREAWERVEESNEILRTVIVNHPDAPETFLQVILQPSTFRSHVVSADNPQRPLQCIELQKVADHWILSLHIHHALYDGVSLDVLISQLQDHLNHKTDKSVLGTEPAKNNTDFPENSDAAARVFWTSYLRDCCTSAVTSSSPAINGRIEIFRQAHLPNAARLAQHARQLGLSTAALLLAAYAKQRTQDKEGQDVVVGIYVANRKDGDTLRSTIPTANIVPLRIKVGHDANLDAIAGQVQEDLRAVQQHPACETSLAQIKTWTGVVMDTIINIVHLPDQETDAQKDYAVTVTEHKPDLTSDAVHIRHFDETSFQPLRGLDLHAVEDAYPVTTDIEMAVRNGALDVGLFAPSNVMTVEEAEAFFLTFREALDTIGN